MKQHETWLQQLVSCLESARTIMFTLAAFSLAAIYIAVFSAAAQRTELAGQQAEKERVAALLKQSDAVLGRLRAFYDGPAEAEQLNFSSLVYALEVTDHHLRSTLLDARHGNLKPADQAFLDFESTLIQNNVFELGAVIGGLIKQKKERIPFDTLSASDLLDLDYHKGKDAWTLYYEWSSLRYALYTKESYGYSKLPDGLDTLEKRFRHHQTSAQKTRNQSTRPPKAGRDATVTEFVAKMVGSGFNSVGELRARVAALDNKIREQERAIGGALKLPFIDQTVEVDYLIWLVPLTVLISMAFMIFYVQRACAVGDWLNQANSELKIGAQAFPWVFLEPDIMDRSTLFLSRALRFVLIALPLSVPAFMLFGSSAASTSGRIAGAICSLLSFAAGWLVMKEVSRLKVTLWAPLEAKPAPPEEV